MQPGPSSQMQFTAPQPTSSFHQHNLLKQNGYRSRSNSIPNSNFKFDKGNLKCHKCQQPGHFANECPKNQGMVMAITGDGNEQQHMQQQQPSTFAGNLNSQWGDSQNYGRGSSQY
jgi:hypothetical protein